MSLYDRRCLKYFCLIMGYSYTVPGWIIVYPNRHQSVIITTKIKFKNDFSSWDVWPISLRLIPHTGRKTRGRQCNSQREEADDSCLDILSVRSQHASLNAYYKEPQDMVPKAKCSKALPSIYPKVMRIMNFI